MTQQSLNFHHNHQPSARMAIAMHIAELIPSRGPADKRQAVTAWARVGSE